MFHGLHCGVNITSLYTERPKVDLTDFIAVSARMWWFRTKPEISLRCACILNITWSMFMLEKNAVYLKFKLTWAS